MAISSGKQLADLPRLRDAIAQCLNETVKFHGTITALLDSVGIARGRFYGWMRDNKFEKETLRRLLKKLKRLGMAIPTADPDKLRDHYRFRFIDSARVREQQAVSLAALWGANASRRVQGEMKVRLACDTLRNLTDQCYLLMLTNTVYPMIYRPGPHLEDISSALADALNNGARIMVFIPSPERLDHIKARVGHKGIFEPHEFASGMEECRLMLHRLLKDKKVLDDAVIKRRLFTHFAQISCDEPFLTCATGRVTLLLGDHSDLNNPKLWGAERFADDSVITYSGKGAFTSIWVDRIHSEAICLLKQEITKLRRKDETGTLTSKEQFGLCGAERLLHMLTLVSDVLNRD